MSEEEELLAYFAYKHLPEHLKAVSKPFHDLAHAMVLNGIDSKRRERLAGLRKLLEAKDCFVRAALQ
jgi:hypothetical protein